MIKAILQILSSILDFPRYYDRIKAYFLKRKIQKLELEVATKDATLAVETLETKIEKETTERKESIHNETQKDTLDDVAKYFSTK